jgi:hypothetical protein
VSDPHWWVGELAHWIGAMPLLWLAIRRSRNRTHWLLAAAFGVSFVADSAAHWVSPDLIGNLYPLAQAGLIAYALLPLMAALNVIGFLTLVSLAAVWFGASEGRDLTLVTVADLAICAMAARVLAHDLLGAALGLSFGVGLIAWWLFALEPSWGSWGLYQLTRVVGTAMFCAAAREA